MFSRDSIDYLREAVRTHKVGRGPLDVQILPTTRCNAACVFCPLHAVPEEAKSSCAPRWAEPASDLHGGLLDRLSDELYKLGGLRRVHLTGGEPLLYRHLLPMMFDTKQCFPDAEFTIVTNGILLQKLAGAMVLSGVDRISVSLNAGGKEEFFLQNPAASPETFERILSGITAVAGVKKTSGSKKPFISVTAVLTKNIVRHVRRFYELCVNAGAGGLTFIPLMELSFAGQCRNKDLLPGEDEFRGFMSELNKLEDEARSHAFYLGFAGEPKFRGALRHDDLYSKIPCYSGYVYSMIWPGGDVRPCCNCEEVMGNLKESSFSSIWRSAPYQEFRDRLLRIPELGRPEGCDCAECGYIYENKMFHELINRHG